MSGSAQEGFTISRALGEVEAESEGPVRERQPDMV